MSSFRASPGRNPGALAQFAREYQTVRRAEGWGSHDGAYYRALPYHDLTGRFPGIWRIRARSYATFVAQVLKPLERAHPSARASRNPLPPPWSGGLAKGVADRRADLDA